ncbi:hypothetical protein GUITHDRAFT_144071 [Guillardia theta CCMP2712]|uniref:Calponin-homology (CH) domain-containing protein n=1 Tax=Guillardia theta (strain CCMP2712) TaxID=905079 RepID=L1IS77_GUITC|nr:hypothetical protein GUITHDRAFT_144071 [Guillardia theta CCMP2712]EKX38680.1 hypothetical protein GUITHDRAFT_144071 [Guillardia theta CCMP2712]|eukprot:XP_005825660.1 hypothetical protein GUITHDRAFT_144071 [Guillardia theta CCMP2712]
MGRAAAAGERQVARWLQSRGLTDVDAERVEERLKDGVLLGNLLLGLDPGLDMRGFNRRVLSRKPALSNLEMILSAVWRKGALGKAMPSAAEIYDGRRDKIFSLLRMIIEVYVLRPARKKHREMLQWIHKVISPYNMELPKNVLSADLDSPTGVTTVWQALSNGVVLKVEEEKQDQQEEEMISVIIEPKEFLLRPSDDIFLLQLNLIFTCLYNRHGQHAGIDVLSLGELRLKDQKLYAEQDETCCRFKDHNRLQERLNRIMAAHSARADDLTRAKALLEDECKELLEIRYEKAMEAVRG